MPFVYGDITDYKDGDKIEWRGYKWIARGHFAEVDLAGGAMGAFSFNWQNPHANPLIITRVIVDETVAGGVATALLDIGTAANTGVHSDNLIDGCDPDVVTVYDNFGDPGANGKFKQRLDANGGAVDWITCQILLQNEVALDGKFYIEYIEVI
ncbi:hypothetical protein ES703_58790 [subsurface metagenome]